MQIITKLVRFVLVALFTSMAVLVTYAGERQEKAKQTSGGTTQFIELAWPEAPETPRIKVVDILASEQDLGRKFTSRESLMKFLTGTAPKLSRMYQPRDVVVSDDGMRVYASDFGQSVVFKFDLEKRKVTTIPSESPFGLALDAQENLYVVEQANKRIVEFDRDGKKIRVITHERLVRPTDIAIDTNKHLIYVADPARKMAEEHSIKVFNFEGELVRTVGNGKGDCAGCLLFPTYLALDSKGNVYVTSTLNARVDVFDQAGKYLKTIGERGTNFGMFDKPKGVALDSFDNVYVADSGWSNVQIFNQKGEVLLYFGGRGAYPGLLKNPTGIAIGKNNRIYVADYLNYRITVYQLMNTKAEDSFASAGTETPQRADSPRPAMGLVASHAQ